MTPVPPWLVVAILAAAVIGTCGAIWAAVAFAAMAHRAKVEAARLEAIRERAMAAAYDTSPGDLFDFSAGLRRQVAVRILTGEDPG